MEAVKRRSLILDIDAPVSGTNQKGVSRHLLLIPLSLTAFFSFLHLGRNSLWLDEAYSVSFAMAGWDRFWNIIIHKEANSSLYFVLLKVWVAAFGDSEFAVRSLSAFFAVAAVGIIGVIGMQLFSRKIAFTAAVMLSLNSFFIQYAQEARGYMLLLLLTACSLYLLLQAVLKEKYRWILLGIVNGLILYTSFLGFLALTAEAVTLLFLPPGKLKWRKLILSCVVTTFAALPLVFFVLTNRYDQLAWTAKPPLWKIPALFEDLSGNLFLMFFYFVFCFLGLASFIRIMNSPARNEMLWRCMLVMAVLVIPITLLYFISLVKPMFEQKFLITTLLALTLLASFGLSRLKPAPFYFTGAVFLVLAVINLYNMYDVRKEDWRSLASYLMENARDGDAIFFYDEEVQIPFEYYFHKANDGKLRLTSIYPFPLGTPIDEKVLTKAAAPSERIFSSLSAKYERLWLILSHDKWPSLKRDSTPVIQSIERHYIGTSQRKFTEKIRLIHYGRK